MKQRYENLIAGLCAAVRLDNPPGIMKSAPFAVDDVAFAFRYDDHAPESMLIYTDFGSMPAKTKKLIYYALLEENFITAIGSTGSFSMSPATKRIVHITQLRLDETTVRTLYDKLGFLADKAKQWRITHYIDDEAAEKPRQAGARSFGFGAGR